MTKAKFKETWERIKFQLIREDIRKRAFFLLSTIIFAFISLGCLIINFITKEYKLGFFSTGSFVILFASEIVELIVFNKPHKIRDRIIAFFAVGSTLVLTFSYVFLGPASSLYLFWICIFPLCFFLSFGLKNGVFGSLCLILSIAIVFYVPGIRDLTRTYMEAKESGNYDSQWLLKVFFLIYYIMCSCIGAGLAYVNITTIKKLDELKDLYYEEANTDSLTGLRNQAYYLTYVNNLHTVVKKGDSIGLMFIDVDDFKVYNDTYGHSVGNEVLVSVAKKLNEVPHALIVRWGGDEFAIVERNLTRDEFIAKANYLLKSVEGLSSGVTISIGLAYYVVDDNFDFQRIFKDADMQAIRAKGKGKNCVIISDKK